MSHYCCFAAKPLIGWDVNFKNLKRKENGKLIEFRVGWIRPTKGKRKNHVYIENDEMHVQSVCVCRTVNFWEHEYAIVHLPLENKHNPRKSIAKKGSRVSWPFKEHISLRLRSQFPLPDNTFFLIFFPFLVGHIYNSKKQKTNKQEQNKTKR